MIAKYPSTCPLCSQAIARGDEIARHNRRDAMCHTDCLPAASRSAKAGYRVEIVASDSDDYQVGRTWQYVHRGVAQATMDALLANTARNGINLEIEITAL